MSATAKIDATLVELAKAFGATEMRINYGQSEDYMRGFNCGYEDAEVEDEPRPYAHHSVPKADPWLDAYLRGYTEGWENYFAHEAGEDGWS